jgi:hypothetical protein
MPSCFFFMNEYFETLLRLRNETKALYSTIDDDDVITQQVTTGEKL